MYATLVPWYGLGVFCWFFFPQVRCLSGGWPIIFTFMLRFTKKLQYSTVCYLTAGTQNRQRVCDMALQFSDQDDNCNQWSFEFIYQVMKCSSEKQIYCLLRTESWGNNLVHCTSGKWQNMSELSEIIICYAHLRSAVDFSIMKNELLRIKKMLSLDL